MSEIYKLPVSSYEELVKVIRAYGNCKVGVPVSLDDLVKSSGMSRTVLSKNNGFLKQMNLITEGSKKAPTELCVKLSKAYSMNLHEQVNYLWRQMVEQDEFISSMISVISVKGGMPKNEYANHIMYASGCGQAGTYRAGAGAVIDILKMLGAVKEEDGKIMIGDLASDYVSPDNEQNNSVNDNIASVEKPQPIPEKESSVFVQQYTCESGQIAKIIIPESATKDDLLGFRDMLNIALKRKFKLTEEN